MDQHPRAHCLRWKSKEGIQHAEAHERYTSITPSLNSLGSDFAAGVAACAFWKGALVRDILIACGVCPDTPKELLEGKSKWYVHFEGADSPSEGPYGTAIPFEHIMDPNNDVIIAFEMNNTPLFPDHGYPIRLVIPGMVGGRQVKWLSKMWISDKDSDNYYHIWDNRVMPSFVTEKDGPFAEVMNR